eukprot:4781757-Alexandrium_andersonii.AAC.1
MGLRRFIHLKPLEAVRAVARAPAPGATAPGNPPISASSSVLRSLSACARAGEGGATTPQEPPKRRLRRVR